MKKNGKFVIWVGFGTAMGVVIGTLFDNVTRGIVFGPAIGLIMWFIFSGNDTKNDNSEV